MKSNPFILTFGREPKQYIPRPNYFNEIEKNFLSETRPNQVYMISGLRGSGKTVLLTILTKRFNELSDWIVIDLNPEREMLDSFASQLYNSSKSKHLFVKLGISLSFRGLGVTLENNKPVEDVETSINKMMECLKKNNKKVLITIDDATNNNFIKSFSHTFQSLIRKDYEIFLLMTGLYENINTIQDNKALTFLSRAPKLITEPLDLPAIKESYKEIFNIDDKLSIDMARLTSGYAYAYQLLGYLFWESEKKVIDSSLLSKYDFYLSEYVYDKIWNKLPEKEKEILIAISNSNAISDIISNTNMNNKEISVYRDRLLKRGIIISNKRGELDFTLPRFKEYVVNRSIF